MLCWLLFNDRQKAPFLAAIVPLGFTLQFTLVGTGLIKDPAAVDAMSRTGDRREILRGPLFYGLAFVTLTILFWRNTPTGMVALMILCGSDGLADILGKGIKSPKLSWSSRKSIAGSLTMFLGRFIFTYLMVWVYIWQGYFQGTLLQHLGPIGLIVGLTTLIESLPFTDIDNITIPLVSAILGYLLFKV
jgi:phytol kinase